MVLVDEGRLGWTTRWRAGSPSWPSPMVVRTPASPVDDVVPARRAITVRDLLTFRSGHGFPADFSAARGGACWSSELRQGPPAPAGGRRRRTSGCAMLATVPLLHHPGDAWLYNTGADILGVLVARVAGRPFAEFLAERIFGPLGMRDTGFHVPAADLDRFTTAYRPDGPPSSRSPTRPTASGAPPPAFSRAPAAWSPPSTTPGLPADAARGRRARACSRRSRWR